MLFIYSIFFFYIQSFSQELLFQDFQKPKDLPESFQKAEQIQLLRPDGIILKGAVLGPKNGDPILLSPGYSGSAAYMSELAELLADKGFRVYSYSLRGKGSGELRSNYRNQKNLFEGQFSFDQMVPDKIAFIEAIYQLHKKPLIIAGHSLSGLVIRAVSTGLVIQEDRHRIDNRLRIKMKKMVKKAVLIKSPSPLITKMDEFEIKMSLKEKANFVKAQQIITRVLPTLSKAKQSLVGKFFGAISRKIPFKNQMASGFLELTDFLLSDVIASSDLKGSKTFHSIRTALAERIEADIIDDIRRFSNEGFITRKGLDMAEAYFDLSTLDQRFPIELISGSKDILAPERFNRMEADIFRAPHRFVGESHMSGLFGKSARRLAKIIQGDFVPVPATICKTLFD